MTDDGKDTPGPDGVPTAAAPEDAMMATSGLLDATAIRAGDRTERSVTSPKSTVNILCDRRVPASST